MLWTTHCIHEFRAQQPRRLIVRLLLAGLWTNLLSMFDLWMNSPRMPSERSSKSIQAGLNSKLLARVTARRHCVPTTSSCGLPPRSPCLDGRRAQQPCHTVSSMADSCLLSEPLGTMANRSRATDSSTTEFTPGCTAFRWAEVIIPSRLSLRML